MAKTKQPTFDIQDFATQFQGSSEERELKGQKVADKERLLGHVRIGQVYRVKHGIPHIDRTPIPEDEVEMHISTLEKIQTETQKELERIKDNALNTRQPIEIETSVPFAMDTQKGMLKSIVKKSKIAMLENNLCAEAAILSVMETETERFQSLVDRGEDSYAAKIDDWRSISHRLIRNILQEQGTEVDHASLEEAPEGRVILADELCPSESIYLLSKKVKALVIQNGLPNGHVATIAKELGIPIIFLNGQGFGAVHDDMPAIVDTQNNKIILHPTKDTILNYEAAFRLEEKKKALRPKYKGKKIQTADGIDVNVYGNINFTASADRAKYNAADGVGLYRTEFLFTERNDEPSIELQRRAYGYVMDAVDGHAVTIRLIDTEGDKNEKEWIRNADIWDLRRNQIKALLLAAADTGSEARILLPTVRHEDELIRTRKMIEEIKAELKADGIAPPNTKLGMMIENPLIVSELESMVEHADFFSIGSNDLSSAMFHINRSDKNAPDIEIDPSRPGFLKQLKEIVDIIEPTGKPLSICGEMASNPIFIPVLLGLGIRKFSMGVENVLHGKELLEKLNVPDCEKMVEQLMTDPALRKKEARYEFLQNFYEQAANSPLPPKPKGREHNAA